MRRISFALTERQFLDGTKTVTRRKGWGYLKPGDRLIAVRKCMGLKKGEKHVVLGEIEVVQRTFEVLEDITAEDVVREGFPGMTPAEFVAMFRRHMTCDRTQMLTRIEFRRVKFQCPSCSGRGTLRGIFPVYAADVPAADRKPVVSIDCPTCAGAGMITPEQVTATEAGRARKAERLARGVGLREEAERLGMLPSVLSAIEAGRAHA